MSLYYYNLLPFYAKMFIFKCCLWMLSLIITFVLVWLSTFYVLSCSTGRGCIEIIKKDCETFRFFLVLKYKGLKKIPCELNFFFYQCLPQSKVKTKVCLEHEQHFCPTAPTAPQTLILLAFLRLRVRAPRCTSDPSPGGLLGPTCFFVP